MKVGILGSGDVAKTLGAGFLKHGHQVTMGTREPGKLTEWAEKHTLKFFTTLEESQMERLQKEFSSSRFVKAFSCVGSPSMVNPQFKNGPPTTFICGDDGAAKQTVTNVLDQFGWETEDLGKVEAARAIEPLCILWCIPGFLRNDWVHALKMLR